MPVTITVRDETTSGEVYAESPLELPTEHMTARELIRERVYQEVQDYNRGAKSGRFRGLVQPTDAERVLNGRRPEFQLKTPRPLDWKDQFQSACEAFTTNRFLLLVDDRQAEMLDDTFDVRSSTQVSFIQLTPLVGG
jgi:hypothetical protein